MKTEPAPSNIGTPSLSIVIPAYNEEAYLGICLEAVRARCKRANRTVEIIVVNNASTDRTKAVATSYPGVTVIDEPRKGIVWARRAGFLASRGELVANIDADTAMRPGWIERVFLEFSRNENLVALSGPFIYYDLPRYAQLLANAFYGIAFAIYLVNRFLLRTNSMLQGGNFVVQRSALETIGGYDTNIYFYGEDNDLGRRLNRIGEVKFTFALPMRASGRRLAGEGIFTTGLRYTTNYFWITCFKRPFTPHARDIRPEDTSKKIVPHYRSSLKEFLIASAVALTFLLVLAGAGLAYRLASSSVTFALGIANLKAEAKRVQDKFVHFSTQLKAELKRVNETLR